MSGYIGNIPTLQATQTRQDFTATASQTIFATAGYTPGYLDVYLNGVKLTDGTDYTASNGSDVVLTTGATASDILSVVLYATFQVASFAQFPFTLYSGAADNIALNQYNQIPFTLADGTPDNIALA